MTSHHASGQVYKKADYDFWSGWQTGKIFYKESDQCLYSNSQCCLHLDLWGRLDLVVSSSDLMTEACALLRYIKKNYLRWLRMSVQDVIRLSTTTQSHISNVAVLEHLITKEDVPLGVHLSMETQGEVMWVWWVIIFSISGWAMVQAWELDPYSGRIQWLFCAMGGILQGGGGHCKSVQSCFERPPLSLWWNLSVLMGADSRISRTSPQGMRSHSLMDMKMMYIRIRSVTKSHQMREDLLSQRLVQSMPETACGMMIKYSGTLIRLPFLFIRGAHYTVDIPSSFFAAIIVCRWELTQSECIRLCKVCQCRGLQSIKCDVTWNFGLTQYICWRMKQWRKWTRLDKTAFYFFDMHCRFWIEVGRRRLL